MPPISFNEVPANARVPFTYVEFDATRGGAIVREFKSLLVGQRLAGGAITEQVPEPLGDAAAARAAFGRGSMLEHMATAFRRNNPTGQLWGVALDDAAAAVKKTATLKVTAASTARGTFYVYVAGRRIAVTLAGATTASTAAAAINAAIVDTQADLPVTSAVATDTVTLTARHGGLSAGAEIDVRINYGTGGVLPAGLAITTTVNAVAGASDPDSEDAFTNLGDNGFDLIAWPYYPDAEMDELEGHLDGTWGASSQLDGIGIAAFRGTASAATTYGNARSSAWSSVMAISDSPTPAYEWAAAIAGAVGAAAEIDPARPFQTLPLRGVLAPSWANRFTHAERETLLTDGMATHTVDDAGAVRIERMISTEQTDAVWLDINTPLTLSHLRRGFSRRMQAKFPRFKLADDGTRFAAGQKVVTPAIARREAIAWFGEQEAAGLVEGHEAFRDGLVVERNAADRNRLDFLLPADLINQLRVVGAQLSFLL